MRTLRKTALTALALLGGGFAGLAVAGQAGPAGSWFTPAAGSAPFARPVAMGDAARDRHDLGRSFFKTPWVEAPAATTARDGLGPLFNANTCTSCHKANGSAPTIGTGGRPLRALVFKLAQPSRHGLRNGIDNIETPFHDRVVDPVYGGQIGVNGNADVAAEGVPRLRIESVPFTYPDGTSVTLQRLHPALDNLGYGPLAPATVIYLRQPPALVGLGLVTRVPDAEILAAADPDDRDGDGISGRPNWVDGPKGRALGRFDWKAGEPSLTAQAANAAAFDMGLTNPLYPVEFCQPAQAACRVAPLGRPSPQGALDLPQLRLEAIAAYLQGFRAPVPGALDARAARGRQLFAQVGCTACHRETLRTGDGIAFHPLSDYLLHDMGEGLADGVRIFSAGPAEFRTAPLWGLGARVRAGHRFLHDARAATPEAAILWHGGEALRARSRFTTLSAADRAAILIYLEHL